MVSLLSAQIVFNFVKNMQGDIVKSRRARGTREERERNARGDAKAAVVWWRERKVPFLCPSRLRLSLTRSCEARFARPNRRACSQAKEHETEGSELRHQPCTKGFVKIFGSKVQDFFQTFSKTIISFSRLKVIK